MFSFISLYSSVLQVFVLRNCFRIPKMSPDSNISKIADESTRLFFVRYAPFFCCQPPSHIFHSASASESSEALPLTLIQHLYPELQR